VQVFARLFSPVCASRTFFGFAVCRHADAQARGGDAADDGEGLRLSQPVELGDGDVVGSVAAGVRLGLRVQRGEPAESADLGGRLLLGMRAVNPMVPTPV